MASPHEAAHALLSAAPRRTVVEIDFSTRYRRRRPSPRELAERDRWMHRVLGSDASRATHKVAAELLRHVGPPGPRNAGTYWLSDEGTAAALGVNPRTVERAKAWLIREGFLVQVERGIRQRSASLVRII